MLRVCRTIPCTLHCCLPDYKACAPQVTSALAIVRPLGGLELSRHTWSRYGPPYPFGRWSSDLVANEDMPEKQAA